MIRDPIVDEVHRVRRTILEECGGDFEKYCERLKVDGAPSPDLVVASPLGRRKAGSRAKTKPRSFRVTRNDATSGDPVGDEIHRVREKIMDESGGDPRKYFARLKALETTHPEREVDLSKRPQKTALSK